MKLGIDVLHSLPYHPQSRCKNERLHRTLEAEVFAFKLLRDLFVAQRAFDALRHIYNFDRPHEALSQYVTASRFRPSIRPMPYELPQVEYYEHEIVRRVSSTKAYLQFKKRLTKVPQAFRGERIALLPLTSNRQYSVFFAAHHVATIDLINPKSARDVS